MLSCQHSGSQLGPDGAPELRGVLRPRVVPSRGPLALRPYVTFLVECQVFVQGQKRFRKAIHEIDQGYRR